MADQMIYQTEKTLKDLEGKIDGSDKANIESKLEELKNVAKGSDLQAIKNATEALQQAFYAASEKMYKQANPQGGCDPNCGGSCGTDDVVDADYETVD
jgi:molecular chaperone DnaK